MIKKKYAYYNAIISKIIQKRNSYGLISLRKRNVLLINLAIYLPLATGVFFSAATIYDNKVKYEVYARRVVLPLEGETSIQKGFAAIKRAYYSVRYQPISYSDIETIFYGYLLAILGAYILSKNTAFKEQKVIEEALIKFKKFDVDNNPWRAVWTPEAIFFEAYGCNPHTFQKEIRFWNAINFSAAPPILFEENKNIFIIPKNFELPSKIIFKSSEIT